MPVIKIELDTDSFNRLAKLAVEERRPVPMHAEVLLLQAIGRWPAPAPCTSRPEQDAAV
jgi:hypothetical protein